MKQKSVLITGCSTGIGRCLALGLHARGSRVCASVKQEKDVAALLAAGVESLVLDLRSSDSIRDAMEEVLARSGGQLYALLNNGAYGHPGAVEALTRAALRLRSST